MSQGDPADGAVERFKQAWEVLLFWLLVAAFCVAVILTLAGRLRVYAGDVGGSGLFLLSAIVQSLAAVLGIAFTLTLIGIQLAAQSYTHRIIRLHTRSTLFVFTFGMFLLGMIYAALVLTWYHRTGSTEQHPWMDLAIIGFVFAVLQLVPFAVRTIRLLAPGNIAYALLARLSPAALTRSDVSAIHDRVGPVFDMARKAIIQRDERTLELLLQQVQTRVTTLLRARGLDATGRTMLVSVVGPELRDLGWLASDRLAIGAVTMTVDALRGLVCEAGASNELRPFADKLYSYIKDIWRESEVRFCDKAYEARLAELKQSMAACQHRISDVVGGGRA